VVSFSLVYLACASAQPDPRRVFQGGDLVLTSEAAPGVRLWAPRVLPEIPGRYLRRWKVPPEALDGRRDANQAWKDRLRATDAVFVFGDAQRKLVRHSVFPGGNGPPVVDLETLAQLLLPDLPFVDEEGLIGLAGTPKSEPLEALLNGMRHLLARLLDALLGESGEQLAYSMLFYASQQSDARPTVQALAGVAAESADLLWGDLVTGAFRKPMPLALDNRSVDQWLASLRRLMPPLPDHETPKRASGDASPVHTTDVDAVFDSLRRANRRFQPRSEQLEYAHFCVKALNRGGLHAVEAGTGTGKTLGMLVPSCEYVRKNPGRKVIIATATKNLQKQITDVELPRLTGAGSPYRQLRHALLKGKGNYLCVTALAEQCAETFRRGGSQEMLACLHLLQRLRLSEGEIEGIPRSLREVLRPVVDFVDEVNAAHSCITGICRLGSDCVYPRRLRTAIEADIVVTNHYKLASASDLLERRSCACFIDEADQFPESYRNSLQVEISDYRLNRFFLRRLLGYGNRRGFVQLMEETLGRASPATDEDRTAVDRCRQATGDIRMACNGIDAMMNEIRDAAEPQFEGVCRWGQLSPPGSGKRLVTYIERLGDLMSQIAKAWQSVLESGRYPEPDARDADPALIREAARVERYRQLAAEFAIDASTIARNYPAETVVHMYRRDRRGWFVSSVPYDIGQFIGELREATSALVFTSATLFVENSLDLFVEELRLEDGFDDSRRIASPFNYRENVLGAVAAFLPPFNHARGSEYYRNWLDQIARAVARFTIATGGRTLVLFTNSAEMKRVFDATREALEQNDIEPLIQDGASVSEIETFRLVERSVLFGVDRFWSGVDFPGKTLSQVIIVRMPNPYIGDPMIEHRKEVMGEEFYERYYQPYTRLKLRQGFGRLIRSETDEGAFVILDSRAASNRSMNGLLDELPVDLELLIDPAEDLDGFFRRVHRFSR
jgi:ATP-dependent DNA helicase DinG